MNKNIRELYYQSWSKVDPTDPKETFVNAFSSLILNECFDIMEKNFAGSSGTDGDKDVWGPSSEAFKAWNTAIKTSRDKIKEHFGVK